jgi:hypothetical protein
MGGRGSGRRSYGGKLDTRDALPLDVRKITRCGLLVDGKAFSWQWLINDEPVASISICVASDQSLVLSYGLRSSTETVEQRVRTQTTPCHLGGQRYWFVCPRCNKRVALLYAPGRLFACRGCWGLAYATQKENAGDRASSRAEKLRTLLGWQAGVLNGDGGKPKGMHWRTFHRLRATHDALAEVAWADIAKRLGLMNP